MRFTATRKWPIRQVRDGPLEKGWGGGGDGEKAKKKFMQGKMPRKKIRAKKKGRKKKFMQKEGPIVIFI